MRKLSFLPAIFLTGCTSQFFQPTRVLYRRPEELGLKYEAVSFPSKDGTKITGLFLSASTSPVRGTIIHFHGNGENMTSHFGFSFWLTAQGYNVFIFDYRGYGASEGSPSMDGAVQDSAAAINYARARNDVDPGRLAVWGQSLGGAIAIASIAQSGGQGIRAVILENTFNSYRDMARDVLSRNMLTWIVQWPLSRLLISDRWAPIRFTSRLPHVPVLVIHGDADTIVPYRFGQKIFSELPEPKEFWRVEGGEHLETFSRFGAIYRPRLTEFLNKIFSK